MPDALARPPVPPGLSPAPVRLPHLCFVAPEAWPVLVGDPDIQVVGGAEVQQGILARLLAGAGYPVSMICLDYGQPDRTVVDGITVYKAHSPDAGWPGLRFLHPRLTRLWRAMQDVNADIYYQRTAAMLTAVVAAFCRHYGKFSIYAGASDPDFLPGRQDIRYRRDRWLFEQGLRHVDRLVVQNTTQQAYCREHYAREAVLIPSCYALPPDAHPGNGRSVLWVGTLRRNKQPESFLELARRLPQHAFVMVGGPGGGPGDSAYFEAIRRQAQALPNVTFTGFLPLTRVEPYFDRAAVLVNTSRHEGMPNTFLQAWARGIPTVAYVDTGAHLEGGPVYAVVRDVADAALEVDRLLRDDLHRCRSAARCRDYFVQTHGPHHILGQYQDLLSELMASRP